MTEQDPRRLEAEDVERPNTPFGHAMTKGAEAVTVPLHGKEHRRDVAAETEGAEDQRGHGAA